MGKIKLFINNKLTDHVGTKNGLNREEWLKVTLQKINDGESILDAGAGEGQFKKLCTHLKYTSQDLAEYDGEGDGSGLHTESRDYKELDIISDITDIPVEDESFDAIMCIEVFEHITNPLDALKEFNRILKKGGKLILTAPFNSLTHYAPYHFSTGFTKYFYQHHLEKYDFKILELTENGNYFEYLAQETRRLKSVSSKYVGKKFNFFEKAQIIFFLRLLKKLSKNDNGSNELLNFGIHVLAEKR